MSEQISQKQRYKVSLFEPEEAGGALIFTFVPKSLQPERGPDSIAKRIPQFIATVRQVSGELAFDWTGSSDDPGDARQQIEAEIEARINDRRIWVDRVNRLVDQVEKWAKEIGWSTRRVEKSLDDAWIGKHRAPALLMQQDTYRFLLEPVGRSTHGAEGVVDLYLMPAYDDIARLYYYDNRWNVHYLFPTAKPVATVREAEAMPLSKEALEKVIAMMRQNAA